MKRILSGLVVVVVVATGLFLLLRWLIGNATPRPETLGLQNGQLPPCPDSPNCVSTSDTDSLHGMEPIAFSGTSAEAHDQLIAILSAETNATILTDQPDYIHAEFRSPLLQFVDDVEFHINTDANQIEFRSASRLGYSDLGANRQRMEAISAECSP